MAAAILGSWVVVSMVHTGRVGFVVYNQSLIRYGGVTAAALGGGEWWRLLTSQFLHVYLLHAVLNAAAVAVVGSQLERAVGTWRFIVVYLCAGTAGQISAVATMPDIVATGASQAALGLAAAALVLQVHKNRSRVLSVAAPGYVVIQVALDFLFAAKIKLPHIVSFGVGACVAAYWKYRSGRAQ